VDVVETLLKEGEALYVLMRTEARFEEMVCRLVSMSILREWVDLTLGAMIGLSESRDMRGIADIDFGIRLPKLELSGLWSQLRKVEYRALSKDRMVFKVSCRR